jgi:hypothetical protein
MSDFVWIISAGKQTALGTGGISPSYIVPQNEMHSYEGQLVGEILWLVFRRQEDRLIGAVTIDVIERFKESYHEGDFLIQCDLSNSVRLCSNYYSAKQYSINSLNSLSTGIHKLEVLDANLIKVLISSKINVKLIRPTESILRNIDFKVFSNDDHVAAKAAVMHIVRSLPLDQIWRSGSGLKLNPVSNFALELLKRKADISIGHDVEFFMGEMNPLTSLLKIRHSSDLPNVQSAKRKQREKTVDLFFTKIEQSLIHVREFINSGDNLDNLEESLRKTGSAEKRHQDILRDICQFLESRGIPAYESRSVDLMFQYGEVSKIYEIKSANLDNIIAQAAKGAFQIACYFNAMKTSVGLEAFLIIEKISDANLEKLVYDALSYLNVTALTYDHRIEWPNRVRGLLS